MNNNSQNPKKSKNQKNINPEKKKICFSIGSLIGISLTLLALAFAIAYYILLERTEMCKKDLRDCKEKLLECRAEPEKPKVVPWDKPAKLDPEIKLLPHESMLKLIGIFEKQMTNEGIRKKEKELISEFRVLQAIYTLKEKRPMFEYVGKVDPKLKYNISGEAFLYRRDKTREIYELLPTTKEKKAIKFKIVDSDPGDTIVAIMKIEKEKGEIESPEKIINWYAN